MPSARSPTPLEPKSDGFEALLYFVLGVKVNQELKAERHRHRFLKMGFIVEKVLKEGGKGRTGGVFGMKDESKIYGDALRCVGEGGGREGCTGKGGAG
uniref:Uncharacterized protein n=1 Tax=Nelumbo nucifera TaxID=4432 RepID=A0A822Y288_NELNU|nr:TPA_asm: hypothetical protein HUJ06_026639 [Nelumbo nucifera]